MAEKNIAGGAAKGSASGGILRFILNNSLAAGIVLVVLFLFIPLPKTIVDIAMALNLALSFVILLTVVYIKQPADFTSFPRVVLICTMASLAINVSSTRIILANPVTAGGAHMAGQSEMVQAFANIVAGNNVVIGFIIFITLIVVQVLVVTRGADRVSEVTARFTLDAMNNKMFMIQNQLNSGSISEEEGERRIAQLRKEIDFYSAMDGASKFVSGNVKAGIFITIVNLAGGVITGVMAGASARDAFANYARLTIGDGLMSQLPALLLSFSTGLLITGSNEGDVLSDQIKEQFTRSGTVYAITGAVLAVLGIAFHNRAAAFLIPIGALFIFVGLRLSRTRAQEAAEAGDASAPRKDTAAEEIPGLVKLDDLSLEIGYALIPLVDDDKGAALISRVKSLRRRTALELGLVIPAIHIMDQVDLPPEEYSFKIRGVEAGRGRVKTGFMMAVNTGGVEAGHEIEGERTRDPAFGAEAVWIPAEKMAEAKRLGYAVLDEPTIIEKHLEVLIRRNAAKILNRQSASDMVEEVKKTNPVVVDEVMGGDAGCTYGEIESVLKKLLEEQVSIRNMEVILETLGDWARITRDVWTLTEKVREALGDQICQQYADENRVLHVLNMSQSLSQKLLDHKVDLPGKGPVAAFDPVDNRAYIAAVSAAIAEHRGGKSIPIILCPSEVRRLVKSSIERALPGVAVLSVNEVMAASRDIRCESLGEIDG